MTQTRNCPHKAHIQRGPEIEHEELYAKTKVMRTQALFSFKHPIQCNKRHQWAGATERKTKRAVPMENQNRGQAGLNQTGENDNKKYKIKIKRQKRPSEKKTNQSS
jgi:hypothetical protein